MFGKSSKIAKKMKMNLSRIMDAEALYGVAVIATALCGAGCSLPVDWRMDPPFIGNDGSACVPDATGPRQFCGTDCVDLNTNLAHCGACGNACEAGAVCALGRCSASCSAAVPCVANGEICVEGVCVYAPPPPSVISTNIEERPVSVRHAPEGLRLSAARSATFYYTVDGTRPMMGAGGTQMAMGQTVAVQGTVGPIMMPGNCGTVQWFADYGPPLGAERIVHVSSFCYRTTDMNRDLAYETIDQFSLQVGAEDRGAIAVVAPGTRVNIAFQFRRALQTNAMAVPTFSRIARVYLDTGMATASAPFCDIYNQMTPTTPVTRMVSVDAPMTPGRYPVRLSLADDPAAGDCVGLNNLGTQRTLGWVIVP